MSNNCLGVYGHTAAGRYLGFRAAQTTVSDSPVGFLTTDPKQTAILLRRKITHDVNMPNFTSAEPFVTSLKKPRIVFIAVPPSEADGAVESISKYLEGGDIVVDCTKEDFRDTLKRGEGLIAKGLQYVGLGMSQAKFQAGGVVSGACFMPGCSRKAYACIEPILSRCGSKARDGRTVSYVAEIGAGKFCTGVLAAIRSAQIQLVSEAFDVLKVIGRHSSVDITNVFRNWNSSELASPMMGALAAIVAKPSMLEPAQPAAALSVAGSVAPLSKEGGTDGIAAKGGEKSADLEDDGAAAGPAVAAEGAASAAGAKTEADTAAAPAKKTKAGGESKTGAEATTVEVTTETARADTAPKGVLAHVIDVLHVRREVIRVMEAAFHVRVPVPTLTAAMHLKDISLRREERSKLAKLLVGPTDIPHVDVSQLQDDLRQAQYAAHICVFAQGLEVIRKTSRGFNWAINLRDIVSIWDSPGGMLCSGKLLADIAAAFERDPSLSNLLLDVTFGHAIIKAQTSLRRVVCLASACGVSCPAFSASLSYFDSIRRERLPLSLAKVHEDFMTGCGFHRDDRRGLFHV